MGGLPVAAALHTETKQPLFNARPSLSRIQPSPHCDNPRDNTSADQQKPPMMEVQKPKKRDRPSAKVQAPPPPEAAVRTTARGDQEARDEDVDRFFALLADVREMRELWRRNGGGGGVATKRTRVDEGRHQQLWRPTFVMEDFAFGLQGSEAHPAKKVDGGEKENRGLDLNLAV